MSDKMLQSDDMTGITKQRSQASPIFDSIFIKHHSISQMASHGIS
jgi:hypothetical protein